ncbi:MAG: pseudouridine synthase [Planctomycetaceae bacterium]
MPHEKRPKKEPEDRRSPKPEAADDKGLVRLQRYLASAGLGSRRHCEEFILAGRVAVDGKVITDLGVRIDPRQEVRVDTEIVRPEPKRYYLLNKPKGCVCTNRDPAGRTRAIDLVPFDGPRLFTVGRLDENSQGLILLTNDGELAHRLAHPRFRVPRKYRVQVVGKPKPEVYEKLKKGLFFEEGKFRVRDVHRVGAKGNSTLLELLLTEGQNREIRRLLARVGHKVINLERIVFGPLRLGTLPTGRFRALSGAELGQLRDFAKGKRLPEFDQPMPSKRRGPKGLPKRSGSPGPRQSSRGASKPAGPTRKKSRRP